MDSLLAGLLAFFTLIALVGGHSQEGAGGVLAEQYWKYVLPNIPMPASLSHLLDTPSAAAKDIGPLNSAIRDNRKYLKAVTDMQLLNGHRDYGKAATATEMQLISGHRDYEKAATATEMQLLSGHRDYEKAATATEMQLLNGHRDYGKAATATEMQLISGHRDYEKAATATEMQLLSGHRDYEKATTATEMQLLNGHRDYGKAATATEMQLLNGHRDYEKAATAAEMRLLNFHRGYEKAATAADMQLLNGHRDYEKAATATEMQLLNGHRDYGKAATATEMQLLNGHRDYEKVATTAEMRLLNFHRGYEKAATAADMRLLNGHRDYEKAATATEMHLLKGHRDYEKAAAATEMQFLNGHRDYGKATPATEMQLLNGHRDYEKAATATEMQLLNGHRDYGKAVTENQLHKHPGVAVFFLEEDIQPGKKLTFHFVPMREGEKFLPSIEADAIPFSSNKIPEILSRFSVNPESAKAAEMTATIHECEKPASKGEKKVCARSLESMVDFATSSLGTSHVNAVSTIVGKDGSPKQDYVVTAIKRKSASLGVQQQLVVCHVEPYPYAVFLCHLTQAVRAYTVSMVGKDGVAVEAAAVCHVDTTGWNPMHISFQILKVKPGRVPVCHFLLQSDVVWTRSG